MYVIIFFVLQGYKVGSDEFEMSHLRYIDDTVLVGVRYVDNLLNIKVVLINFEFPSGLKVNFTKSCLFDVNVGRTFWFWWQIFYIVK